MKKCLVQFSERLISEWLMFINCTEREKKLGMKKYASNEQFLITSGFSKQFFRIYSTCPSQSYEPVIVRLEALITIRSKY